jgi:type IV secretory pathway ATPase VirB11/archaellum biosynthesis ATPase
MAADDNLKAWQPVEQTRGNDAQQMHPGLNPKPEDGAIQARLRQRSDHAVVGEVRVQVQRNIKFLQSFQDREVSGVVEVVAVDVRVADQSFEPKVGNPAV